MIDRGTSISYTRNTIFSYFVLWKWHKSMKKLLNTRGRECSLQNYTALRKAFWCFYCAENSISFFKTVLVPVGIQGKLFSKEYQLWLFQVVSDFFTVLYTYCPLDVWTSRVINVEVAGHIQFRASIAYLNSSSHTTWSVGEKNTSYFTKIL